MPKASDVARALACVPFHFDSDSTRIHFYDCHRARFVAGAFGATSTPFPSAPASPAGGLYSLFIHCGDSSFRDGQGVPPQAGDTPTLPNGPLTRSGKGPL